MGPMCKLFGYVWRYVRGGGPGPENLCTGVSKCVWIYSVHVYEIVLTQACLRLDGTKLF